VAFIRGVSALILLSASAIAQVPAETVTWTTPEQAITHKDIKSGHATLSLQGAVAAGWHLYALKQVPEGPTPLVVTVADNPVAKAGGAATGTTPSKVHDPAFDLDTQFYAGAFTLTVPVRFAPHTTGQQSIPVNVRFQTCNGRICQPPKTVRLSVPVTLEG
jgi:hypothetical protein